MGNLMSNKVFIEHGAPESIRIYLREAIKRRNDAAKEIKGLKALLERRTKEQERGEWPRHK